MENRDGTVGSGFGSVLQSLKRDGALVLVTGVASDAVLDSLGTRLLGESGPDRPRLRVLGALNRVPLSRVLDRLTRARDNDGTAHVVTTAAHRATLSGRAAGETARPSVTTVDDEAAFAARFPDLVDDLVDDRGGVAPAELRVGVDSLRALAEAGVDCRPFVAALRDLLKTHRGLGHVVLPAEPDAEAVGSLREEVDVVVELRTHGGVAEHRWALPGHGHRTDWLPYLLAGDLD